MKFSRVIRCRLCCSLRVPRQLFEIRYICNLIANPMDLSLLRVSVKVIDARSGAAEAIDAAEPEAASASV